MCRFRLQLEVNFHLIMLKLVSRMLTQVAVNSSVTMGRRVGIIKIGNVIVKIKTMFTIKKYCNRRVLDTT